MAASSMASAACRREAGGRVVDDVAGLPPAEGARGSADTMRGVMACFGVQSRGAGLHAAACGALLAIARSFALADGPHHHDLAHYVDEAGCDNMVAIAHWAELAAYQRWVARPDVVSWWEAPERLGAGLGYFREIVAPGSDRLRVAPATPDRPRVAPPAAGDGVLRAPGGGRAPHGRLALVHPRPTAPASPAAAPPWPTLGPRVRVSGHENVVLIRSGQEWSQAEGDERVLYLRDMEPLLRESMAFLRDQGRAIGCYTNRYMNELGADGQATERTFCLSYWRSLSDMERWMASGATHVAVFGTFLRIVQALDCPLKLRLHHEVSVLKAAEQSYEYIHCHPRTGLLNGLAA